MADRLTQSGKSAYEFAVSQTGQGILKCSIAYLIGSLATFVPAFANFIGKGQDSKHLVATCTVYFHPARTIGSMHEATVLAFVAFCYAAFISFTSMGISMLFGKQDLLEIGHAIVLIVFCGGGLGFVAWTKQFFGHPLVNVACSLASLGSITILVKEGSIQAGSFSDDKVVQVLLMVIMGVIATMLVNFIVLPVRARVQLNKDLTRNTDLLGEILIVITRSFLLGQQSVLADGKQLEKDHQASLTSMKKNLIEAQREHYVLGTEGQYLVEKSVVECLERLSQDLGGLKSSALAQFSMLKSIVGPGGGTTPQQHAPLSSPNFLPADSAMSPSQQSPGQETSLGPILEAPEENEAFVQPSNGLAPDSNSPVSIFVNFVNQLGPPAKSLVYTLKQILDDLPFQSGSVVAVNEHFRSSLRQAIDMYRQSRKDALEHLYSTRSKAISRRQSVVDDRQTVQSFLDANGSVKKAAIEAVADFEEVSASCGHFSFALLDFAEDMLQYLELLEELKTVTDPKYRKRTWKWLKFWRHHGMEAAQPPMYDTFHEDDENQRTVHDIPSPIHKADHFADPEMQKQHRSWTYSLYRRLRVFRRDDVKFAIKVGIGAALYALPAFLPSTRSFFTHWRGEWGLVSYMVVCSMTIGASNTTGINRFIGTGIGACCAILAWIVSNHEGRANPWLLGFIGWLMALGCFYIIIEKGDGPMGRFILLTYNLGALYAYSLSVHDDDNDDDEGGIDPAIWEIVGHRVASVVVGCLWGIFITRFIWPTSARRKLKDGLCILWLRMSLIWRRDPLAMFLLGEPKSSYMDIREEAQLQSFLSYLDSLRKAASSEFELRGPFPDKITSRVVESTQRMLSNFHAMNVVISKNLQCTPGEAAVLRYTREDRFALSARISHLFSVLASSLKLEYPLNDVLPNIENRRDNLLAKIFEFRRSEQGSLATEQDYELLYAYVLVTGQLAQDIQAVITELENLFGTLNEDNLKLQ